MKWNKDMIIFRKTIEVNLKTDQIDYVLDKFQQLNNKPINKFIIPNLNFTFYPLAMYGGTGTYTNNPLSIGGKPLARIEAINGAYLYLTDSGNRLIADQVPLMLYRQDPDYFGEKGLFKDYPCVDFTQTKIAYPNNAALVNAQNGNSIMIVVEYWDVKDK